MMHVGDKEMKIFDSYTVPTARDYMRWRKRRYPSQKQQQQLPPEIMALEYMKIIQDMNAEMLHNENERAQMLTQRSPVYTNDMVHMPSSQHQQQMTLPPPPPSSRSKRARSTTSRRRSSRARKPSASMRASIPINNNSGGGMNYRLDDGGGSLGLGDVDDDGCSQHDEHDRR